MKFSFKAVDAFFDYIFGDRGYKMIAVMAKILGCCVFAALTSVCTVHFFSLPTVSVHSAQRQSMLQEFGRAMTFAHSAVSKDSTMRV